MELLISSRPGKISLAQPPGRETGLSEEGDNPADARTVMVSSSLRDVEPVRNMLEKLESYGVHIEYEKWTPSSRLHGLSVDTLEVISLLGMAALGVCSSMAHFGVLSSPYFYMAFKSSPSVSWLAGYMMLAVIEALFVLSRYRVGRYWVMGIYFLVFLATATTGAYIIYRSQGVASLALLFEYNMIFTFCSGWSHVRMGRDIAADKVAGTISLEKDECTTLTGSSSDQF